MSVLLPPGSTRSAEQPGPGKSATGAGTPATRAGGALLIALAVLVSRLLWQGTFTAYVRPRMAIPLAIAAAVLAAIGLLGLFRSSGPTRQAGSSAETGEPDRVIDGHHGHAHAAFPKTSWLLVLPLLVLTLVAPGPLSAADAAITSAPTALPFQPTPLHPDAAGVLTMKLRDLTAWTKEDPRRLLLHRPLRLVGMAQRVSDRGRVLRLSRFTITCCAADALAFSADLTLAADTPLPEKGAWLEVIGSWNGGFTSDGWPRLEGIAVEVITPPAEPYEL